MSNRLPKGLSITPIDSKTVARLYDTNIVVIDHSEGTVTLNSNSWRTNHTKKCTNLVLNSYGIYVYQKSFNWYVTTSNGTVEYDDHMTIKLQGE